MQAAPRGRRGTDGATPTAPGATGPVAYLYLPPDQVVARAATCIGDVVLRFSLTLTGSLTLLCPPAADGSPGEPVHGAGAALHGLATGLFVSSTRANHPRIESRGGHRFVHRAAQVAGPRTRRFTGECEVHLPGGRPGESGATLGYTLDVTADSLRDPPGGGGVWSAHHDDSLASVGAIVLEALPIAAGHAAQLLTG